MCHCEDPENQCDPVSGPTDSCQCVAGYYLENNRCLQGEHIVRIHYISLQFALFSNVLFQLQFITLSFMVIHQNAKALM